MRSISYFDKNSSKFLKAVIISTSASVVLIIALMCILSALLTISSALPYEYLAFIMLAVIGISVFIGTYIAARINKSKGLYIGITNGFIVYIALLSSGFCMSGETITILTLLKPLICCVCSMLGGVKGVNVKDKIKIR